MRPARQLAEATTPPHWPNALPRARAMRRTNPMLERRPCLRYRTGPPPAFEAVLLERIPLGVLIYRQDYAALRQPLFSRTERL